MQFNVNDIDLAILVENMPDLILYLDMDKKLLSFNAGGMRFLKIIGCDNPVPGDEVLKYYTKEKQYYLKRQLNELVEGNVFSFEDSFHHDSRIFHFDISLY
ncbi:MAG: hypothetical protein JWM28_4208, partial [Chitinophagaceae bacterium]|nr:hypothetical protein [Chitinophagaceae bacterium]